MDGGKELVVVRGPDVPGEVLRGLLPDNQVPQPAYPVYSVRLELRSPNQPPLVLCSRPAGGAFQVFDLIVERREEAIDKTNEASTTTITLAVGGDFEIALWQIPAFSPFPDRTSSWTYLRDWALYASPTPIGRDGVTALLGRSDDDKLLVEVVDARGIPGGHHTLFQQVEGQWHFKLVKKWLSKDRDPATRPTTRPNS